MERERFFRGVILTSFVALTVIRVYYQKQVLSDQRKIEFKEGPISLAAGSIAALTTLVFGFEYVFFRGAFSLHIRFFSPHGCAGLASSFSQPGSFYCSRRITILERVFIRWW